MKICCVQKVKKKLWKTAEEPLEGLLTQIAPSHASVRREIMIGLAQCRFHLNRDHVLIQEAIDVRQLFVCCFPAHSSSGGRKHVYSEFENDVNDMFPGAGGVRSRV